MSSNPSSTELLLAGLPPNTNAYKYDNFKAFESNFTNEGNRFYHDPKASQFVLFTHLPPDVFERDFEDPIRGILCNLIDGYYPAYEAVVIKMKTGAHEVCHGKFNNLFIKKLVYIDADQKLLPLGGTTIRTDGRIKEADQIFEPIDLPSGRSKHWPSFVIEVGYVESARRLRDNADWWFSASGGDVKVVLTIVIHRQESEREVNIRVYGWGKNGTTEEQHVTVTATGVKGAPLVLAFDRVFLADPETADEGDMEFTDDDFKHLAYVIWNEQFS